MTIGSVKSLCRAVNESTIDYKLADVIEKDIAVIRADIVARGFSLVTVCGRTFRIKNKKA